MDWFFVSLLAYFCLGLSAVVDKFIISKTPLVPASFSFYVTLLGAAFVSALFLFEPHFSFPQEHLLTLLIAGASLYFGLFFMFSAYIDIEVSKANPIIISFIPLFTFIFDFIIRQTLLSTQDLIAGGLIVAGGFFLSQSGMAKTRIGIRGWLYIITAGLMLAVSNVFSKMAYNELPFFTAFMWQRWAAFLTALVFVLVSGKWHSIILRRKDYSPTSDKSVPLKTFFFGQAVAAVGIILQQYAIKEGNVTLVSAMNGAQFLFVLLLVFLASRFFPKILQEDMTRGSLFQKIVWSVTLCVGLALLFVNVDLSPPNPAVPQKPAMASVVATNRPYLKWSRALDTQSDIRGYLVVVSTNNKFAGRRVSKWNNGSPAATNWTVSRPLSDHVYYWRVLARDATGNRSAWSRTGRFTVAAGKNRSDSP